MKRLQDEADAAAESADNAKAAYDNLVNDISNHNSLLS